MRCILVVTGLAYGGAETQLVQLATQFKTRGWEVRVVSLMPPRAFVEELNTTGIPVSSLGITKKLPDPRPVIRLARLIRSWRPHIIHSHMVHANLLTRAVRLLAPASVLICTAHNTNEGGRLRELLYLLTDPLCDLTTQVSQAGLENYVRVRAAPADKIRFIPNGVDTEQFRPDIEARSRLRYNLKLEGSFVWLAVGRFDLQKDYANMLKAFAHVFKKRVEALLLIAGDGPLRLAMQELARTLHISNRIRFLGIRRDVPELMNSADAYVMSSDWEGMPMVLLEAEATGLPIIATDVGGNREVVVDGKTGFLVPSKNPEALSQAMLRIMKLPKEALQRMGEAARQYIEANFSLDQIVNQWEALYRELLVRKGKWVA